MRTDDINLGRVRSLFVVFAFALSPASAFAQWAYVAPPWNFDEHPKFKDNDPKGIPMRDWQQLASFDSARRCESAKLFARDIRLLSPNDREYLMTLFASGAEQQARSNAGSLIAAERTSARDVGANPQFRDLARLAERKALNWWSASKCVQQPARNER